MEFVGYELKGFLSPVPNGYSQFLAVVKNYEGKLLKHSKDESQKIANNASGNLKELFVSIMWHWPQMSE